jgi:hypothetical protein
MGRSNAQMNILAGIMVIICGGRRLENGDKVMKETCRRI